MNESWKAIPGYEGFYEASTLGRIRSISRRIPRRRKGRVLKPKPASDGRKIVTLCKNTRKTFYIGQLVLKTFVGPRPSENMQMCHFPDPNPANNTLANLRWGTPAENQADRVIHGTNNNGERHPMAKLNDTDIERIFDLRKYGCTQLDIAKWINISGSSINMILNGKRWSHLSLSYLNSQ